jgi:hypothetical protein
MKKLMMVFTILCVYIFSHAQSISNSVISAGGNFSTSTWGSLSATMGEAIIANAPAAGFILLQGFQQPVTSSVGITSLSQKSFFTNLYPNPGHQQINLVVNMPEESHINYGVYDVCGKKLLDGNFVAGQFVKVVQDIDISILSVGSYIVNVSSNGLSIQNFKLQVIE